MSTLKARFPGKPTKGNGIRESVSYSITTNTNGATAPAPVAPIQVTPILISSPKNATTTTTTTKSRQRIAGAGAAPAATISPPLSSPSDSSSGSGRPSRSSARKSIPAQKFSPSTTPTREKKLGTTVPTPSPTETSSKKQITLTTTKKSGAGQSQVPVKNPSATAGAAGTSKTKDPPRPGPIYATKSKGGIPESEYSVIAAQTATNLKAFRALFGSSGESDEEFLGFTHVSQIQNDFKRKARAINLEVLSLQRELITASRSYSLSSEEEGFTPVVFPKVKNGSPTPMDLKDAGGSGGTEDFPGFSDDDIRVSSAKAQKMQKVVSESESELQINGDMEDGDGGGGGKRKRVLNAKGLLNGYGTGKLPPARRSETYVPGSSTSTQNNTIFPISKYPRVGSVNDISTEEGAEDGAYPYRSGKFILENSTESEETTTSTSTDESDEDNSHSLGLGLDNKNIITNGGTAGSGTNEEADWRADGDEDQEEEVDDDEDL